MMVFDAVARHESGMISMATFKKIIGNEVALPTEESSTFFQEMKSQSGRGGRYPTLKEAEDFLIEEALIHSNGNQSIAALQLGISRQALNKRLARASKSK